MFHGPGPGRPKGSQDKTGIAVREMIRQALVEVGGIDYLVRQADENPVAFMSLIAKLMPTEITAKITGELTSAMDLREVPTSELLEIVKRYKTPKISAGDPVPAARSGNREPVQ